LPGSDQIPAEMIQVGVKTLLSAIHKLISSVWSKGELPDHWKEYIIVPIHKKWVTKLTIITIMEYNMLSTSYKILSNILEKKWEYNETVLKESI
jgi:hypothetical protein